MKRKYIYILLALSVTCTMFSACKKNDSVETVNIVEETTSIVEIETVTEEIETTTVVEEECTTEVVESTEEIETTTVEEVYSTEEVDNYEGMSESEIAQQIISEYLKKHAQDNQIEVDVPGGTAYDPSQDGTNPYNPNIDVPEHLQGKLQH